MAHDILVTGNTGFIGRNLTPVLEARGCSVRGFSSLQGNIARDSLPDEAVGHVFHLAGRSFVPESWQTPLLFYETNVLGTVNVLDYCRRHGATLTLISSYVYGQPKRLPIREDDPIEAVNPYSHSKILAEEAAAFYARNFKVAVTVIRPFNLYGAGQDKRFLIPALIAQAIDLNSEVVEVADGRPKRDFLHVKDFADLLAATIAHPGGIYNAGSGVSVSVEELAKIVCAAAGIEKRFISRKEYRPNEILDVVADVSLASRDFGWAPKTPLIEGIAATVLAMRDSKSSADARRR